MPTLTGVGDAVGVGDGDGVGVGAGVGDDVGLGVDFADGELDVAGVLDAATVGGDPGVPVLSPPPLQAQSTHISDANNETRLTVAYR